MTRATREPDSALVPNGGGSAGPAGSTRPFGGEMRVLMAERAWTFRQLAEAIRGADAEHRGLSHGFLVHLAQGRERPTEKVMVKLANAFGVAPEHFAEYRLRAWRDLFDERTAGLDVALARLASAQDGLNAVIDHE